MRFPAAVAIVPILLAAACSTPAAPEAIGGKTSKVTGGSCSASRDDILASTSAARQAAIQRGFAWLDAQVPYSQSKYYGGYRTDCSGFVSMCWDLGTSTDTAELYAAGTYDADSARGTTRCPPMRSFIARAAKDTSCCSSDGSRTSPGYVSSSRRALRATCSSAFARSRRCRAAATSRSARTASRTTPAVRPARRTTRRARLPRPTRRSERACRSGHACESSTPADPSDPGDPGTPAIPVRRRAAHPRRACVRSARCLQRGEAHARHRVGPVMDNCGNTVNCSAIPNFGCAKGSTCTEAQTCSKPAGSTKPPANGLSGSGSGTGSGSSATGSKTGTGGTTEPPAPSGSVAPIRRSRRRRGVDDGRRRRRRRRPDDRDRRHERQRQIERVAEGRRIRVERRL